MARKPTERKVSKVVADLLIESYDRLRHVPKDEIDRALSDYRRRQERDAAAPVHIRIVRGGLNGYTEDQIVRLAIAEELADRERTYPADFVSNQSFRKTQSMINPKNGSVERYDHDEIKKEAAKLGYFELEPNSRARTAVLNAIITKLRLREENHVTSLESWQRTLRRILNPKPQKE